MTGGGENGNDGLCAIEVVDLGAQRIITDRRGQDMISRAARRCSTVRRPA